MNQSIVFSLRKGAVIFVVSITNLLANGQGLVNHGLTETCQYLINSIRILLFSSAHFDSLKNWTSTDELKIKFNLTKCM